jgi:hypothetical protein
MVRGRVAVVVLPAISVIAAACGSGTPVRTVTAPPKTVTAASPPTTSTPGSPPDCDAAGINSKDLKEGTCVRSGHTYVVGNKASTLHLKSMDVTLSGMNTQNSLSNGSGMSATANGKFVISTLTLKNKLDRPSWLLRPLGTPMAVSTPRTSMRRTGQTRTRA